MGSDIGLHQSNLAIEGITLKDTPGQSAGPCGAIGVCVGGRMVIHGIAAQHLGRARMPSECGVTHAEEVTAVIAQENGAFDGVADQIVVVGLANYCWR